MRHLIVAVALLLLDACANPQSNLDRLRAECAVAPLGVAAAGLIPVPGAGTVAGLTVAEICAHPEMIAGDEAKIAAAIQALRIRK